LRIRAPIFRGLPAGLPTANLTASPAQTSYNFRANAFDFFVQDDWRFRSNLSFNLGLRYEYNGPYAEAGDRISNLDVAPGFTTAGACPAGANGPYNGVCFPASLVRPDRNNFAPRIGIAWKPQKQNGW